MISQISSSLAILLAFSWIASILGASLCQNNEMDANVKVETLTYPMVLGEGPFWMEDDQSLVFVDILAQRVNRYYTRSKRLQVLNIDGAGDEDIHTPSFIIPVGNFKDHFVVGLGHSVALIKWSPTDDDEIRRNATPIVTVDENFPKNVFNDAKVDPKGRLWAGTKGTENSTGALEMNTATLYRIDQNLSPTGRVHEVTISNGMTWSMDQKIFYYIDSTAKKVYAFDYNNEEGEIKNQRTLLDFEKEGLPGVPDGMTIDTDGNLWVACFEGHQVISVNSDGEVIRKIRTPSNLTTSCTFGGPDYSTLYVTTASISMSEEEIAAEPDSGKTLAITGLGVKGLPGRPFNIDGAVIGQFMSMDKN